MIEPKKDSYVTKSEKLLKARYELNELAIKLIAILYSNVKRSDEIGKDYEIRVADIANLMNKDYGEFYNELKDATEELMSNPVFIEDKEKKEWIAFNWISDAQYKNGVIVFSIAKRLKPFVLELQSRFVKYRLENILPLRSKYVIRLYEILKDKFGEKTFKNGKKEIEYIESLSNLRNYLGIPKSYQYSSHIKKLIIEKAKVELKKHTDISFSYEEIKTGRKVTHLKFYITKKQKENKKLHSENRVQKKKSDFKSWRKDILSKGDIILKLENQTFEIKEGLLAKNGDILDKEEAWKTWKFLFKNKDNVLLLNKDELKKEIKEDIKKRIFNAFKNKLFKAIPIQNNGEWEYINAELINIKEFNNENDFVAIFKSGEKTFAKRTGVNQLNNFLK